MSNPKNDLRMEIRPEIEMKKTLLSICTLLILALGSVSCDREKAEYGGDPQPVEHAKGRLSLAAMTISLSEETETHEAVLRPEAAETTRLPAGSARPKSVTPTDASYTCKITDSQGNPVSEFTYGQRPETIELPVGAYTFTVGSAGQQAAAAWDAPVYTASRELLIDKNTTAEVGKVLCTPAAVSVSLAFDAQFDAGSTATVSCGGEALTFNPAESRTAYFAVGESRTLTVSVAGSIGAEPVTFTQRYTDVQPGQWYRLTVKGQSLSAPVIEWLNHDITQRYRAEEGLDARIRVTAAAGISSFLVEIISEEVLTPEVLGSVGLTSLFDLTQPGERNDTLQGLGFPTGDAVTGHTEVSFDISQFMGLIPLLGNGDSDFKLTVTDKEGQTSIASIMVYSSDEPDPETPEQAYPGGDAKLFRD